MFAIALFPILILAPRSNPQDSFLRDGDPGRLQLSRIGPLTISPRAGSNKAEWMASMGFVDTYSDGRCAGYVWDSSKLLPGYLQTESEQKMADAAKRLGRLFADSSFDPQLMFLKKGESASSSDSGILVSQLSPSAKADFLSNVDAMESAASAEDLRGTLQLDTFVTIESDSGVTERFLLKRSRDMGSTGSPLLLPQPRSERIPKELASVLRSRPVSPDLLNGRRSVSELVAMLGKESGLSIYADRRVESDLLDVRARANLTLNLNDLALAIARAMNMYWRKVDDVYFLGISPRDPRELSEIQGAMKIRGALRPVLKAAEAAGLLPPGVTAESFAAAVTASDLPPSFLGQLQDRIAFRSGEDRQRFLSLASGGLRTGSVRLTAVATPYARSNERGVAAGGYAFQIGFP